MLMIALNKRSYVIGAALLIIGTALFLLVDAVRTQKPDWVTAQVDRGTVSQIVSVSGFIEAKNTAQLAFPSSGVVTEVYAHEGQHVVEGEVLATLASSQLVAQRNEALAGLQLAEASYDKLVAGADAPDRTIAALNVQNAEQSLARTIEEENAKVENAQKTLRSSDLSALSADPIEESPAPSVTGTYTCDTEGSYMLEVYASNAPTRFSYKFTGLETGSRPVSVDQPAALGSCGLYVQFSPDESYAGSKWTIDIPNTRSSSYVTNKNAYDLAKQQADNAIQAAREVLALTQEQSASVEAAPRSENVREADAAVRQAQAKIAQIDALLADRSIIAPFDGMVTSVEIVRGETAPIDPVVTVLASDAFELKTRIPEIDITKLEVGQDVEAVFDAQPFDIRTGNISYISPLAIIIDGVAYFEATIELDEMPSWIKSGLNADVDIIVDKRDAVLRIPKRFLIESTDNLYSVRVQSGNAYATTSVTPSFMGNDGFVEITGLNEGDTVIAP